MIRSLKKPKISNLSKWVVFLALNDITTPEEGDSLWFKPYFKKPQKNVSGRKKKKKEEDESSIKSRLNKRQALEATNKLKKK